MGGKVCDAWCGGMHASISDLTTYSRDATGNTPHPSIGSSTTVIGSSVYLFGGKSTTSRKSYTADIYCFDLASSTWEKIVPTNEEALNPVPRYFHSADYWEGNLVIFGGIGSTPPNNASASREGETTGTSQSQSQSVLKDVRFFSLAERRWLDPSLSSPPSDDDTSPDSLTPRPRFAHLSTIAASKLFILGGQDMVNEWLDDIHVFDLLTLTWISHVSYPRNCGTYRSAVVSPALVVRDPGKEGVPTKRPESMFAKTNTGRRGRSGSDTASVMAPHPLQAQNDQLVHMPYSAEPTAEHPAHLYIYSNWNVSPLLCLL